MASYNPNYVGGDIMTGSKDIRQLTFGPRITLSPCRVGVPGMHRRPRQIHIVIRTVWTTLTTGGACPVCGSWAPKSLPYLLT